MRGQGQECRREIVSQATAEEVNPILRTLAGPVKTEVFSYPWVWVGGVGGGGGGGWGGGGVGPAGQEGDKTGSFLLLREGK